MKVYINYNKLSDYTKIGYDLLWLHIQNTIIAYMSDHRYKLFSISIYQVRGNISNKMSYGRVHGSFQIASRKLKNVAVYNINQRISNYNKLRCN